MNLWPFRRRAAKPLGKVQAFRALMQQSSSGARVIYATADPSKVATRKPTEVVVQSVEFERRRRAR